MRSYKGCARGAQKGCKLHPLHPLILFRNLYPFPLALFHDAAFDYKAVRIHGVAVNILERRIEIGMEEALLGQIEVENVR